MVLNQISQQIQYPTHYSYFIRNILIRIKTANAEKIIRKKTASFENFNFFII
jgi:hypothetical protein